MGSEWIETTIGELCSKVLTGGTPLTKHKEYYEGGVIPWLKTKEVNFGRIHETEYHITELGLNNSAAKLVPSNSVIVAMYGQGDTAGRVAVNKIPVSTNQACCNLVIDSEKADYRFIYYFLKKSYSELVRRKTGSAQPNLNTGIIKDFEVFVPPLKKQRKIGAFLWSLDNKIQLNRQTNQTLEHMAQALFKSWFVDFDPVIDNALAAGNPIPEPFQARAERRAAQRTAMLTTRHSREGGNPTDPIDPRLRGDDGVAPLPEHIRQLFPTEFVFDAEMGWIPEGWETVTFSKIVEKYIDNRGKTPPLAESGTPLLEVKHLPDESIRPILETEKRVSDKTYDSWFRAHLEPEDIIISTVGTIGRLCLVPSEEKLCIAQNLLGFRFNRALANPYFMYYQMDGYRFRYDVDARLVVTVQQSIKRKDLETIDLLKPPIDVQDSFEEIIKPMVARQLSKDNLYLAKLRDTLLPKLISGELRLSPETSEPQQQAEAAIAQG